MLDFCSFRYSHLIVHHPSRPVLSPSTPAPVEIRIAGWRGECLLPVGEGGRSLDAVPVLAGEGVDGLLLEALLALRQSLVPVKFRPSANHVRFFAIVCSFLVVSFLSCRLHLSLGVLDFISEKPLRSVDLKFSLPSKGPAPGPAGCIVSLLSVIGIKRKSPRR